MSRINYVLAGKYEDEKLDKASVLFVDHVAISHYNISSYQVIDEANVSQFSGWKALMGISALGSVGMALGIDGDSRKEYLISIDWKDGEKSLILIDHNYYVTFVRSMFED